MGGFYQILSYNIYIFFPLVNSMSYQYDIFLSYKRDPETYRWIKDHFEPLLTHSVALELGRSVSVFIDDQIEAGSSWPVELGMKIGQSRIIAPLFSRTYFSSRWCCLELSLMLSREKEVGYRTTAKPNILIVPAAIHDGSSYPAYVGHIQHFGIQNCFNVRMGVNSPRAEELADILSKKSSAFADAIKHAPRWRTNWQETAAEEFYKQLYQETPQQDSVPRLINT